MLFGGRGHESDNKRAITRRLLGAAPGGLSDVYAQHACCHMRSWPSVGSAAHANVRDAERRRDDAAISLRLTGGNAAGARDGASRTNCRWGRGGASAYSGDALALSTPVSSTKDVAKRVAKGGQVVGDEAGADGVGGARARLRYRLSCRRGPSIGRELALLRAPPQRNTRGSGGPCGGARAHRLRRAVACHALVGVRGGRPGARCPCGT